MLELPQSMFWIKNKKYCIPCILQFYNIKEGNEGIYFIWACYPDVGASLQVDLSSNLRTCCNQPGCHRKWCQIWEVVGSHRKDPDQLKSYHAASLHLCFPVCKRLVFLQCHTFSRTMRKPTTNRAVQAQKLVRGWKFWI